MFYVITVFICGILLIAANMLRIPFSWGELLRISLSVALGIVSIFALDGIFAFVIRRCQKGNINSIRNSAQRGL